MARSAGREVDVTSPTILFAKIAFDSLRPPQSRVADQLLWGLMLPYRLTTHVIRSTNWMKHQQPLSPQWHERATRAEINEVEAIDKLIANLRLKRESIVNRTKMRTQLWVAHHSERRASRRKSAA